MIDQWAVPLTFFSLHLSVLNFLDSKHIPVFKGITVKGIDLWFLYHCRSNVNVDILYDFIDFIKEKEIHYDMENKTATNLDEKYKPTIVLDESELLYIKLKFESIIGEISIGY